MNQILLKKLFFLSIAFIAIIGLFSSCNYNPSFNYHGELQSNGFIRYFLNDKKMFIPDSIKGGDPAVELLRGYYSRHDSVLSLNGSNWTLNDRINLQLTHCHDTGFFDLGPLVGSFAQVSDNGSWSTDSLHRGKLHLTQFDTINGLVTGIFTFSATSDNSDPKIILIDSGSFVDFHFTMLE